MPTYGNIGGAQKQIEDWYSNIGGARKQIQTMYANVGSARKIIYESGIDYWSIPYSSSGTLSSSTRYSRMVSTSATVNSSGTFTLQNATSKKGRPAAGTFMVKVNNGSSTTTTGTTLYYFYNSTGGYYAFSTNVTGQSSATAVSRVKSTTYTSDVVYDSSSGKLLLKVLLVPAYYRWEVWEAGNTTYTYHETSRGSGTVYAAFTEGSSNYINNFNSYTLGYSNYPDNATFKVEDYYTDTLQILEVGKSLMNGYTYMGLGHPYASDGTVHLNPIYKGAKISERIEDVDGIHYSFTYTNELTAYATPSTSSSILTGYVFSPNSSAYTTGPTYKNKTTL